MKKVAIIGPGLLGGSAALALRAQAGIHVALWARRPEAIEEAMSLGVAQEVSSQLSTVVRDADTVLLCVPVGAMEGLVRQMLPDLAPRTLVTDVGSVKGVVVETLAPLLEGRALFTGSHPMAGSEKAGIRFARADLFANATCIVTPRTPQESSSEAVARAKELWECLGGRVAFLGPHEHDRFCALISHMPHLLAAVLVHAVQASEPRAFAFCGPGFRDTTRVAGGLPEMWREILCSNREAVLEALNAVSHQIELAKALLHAPGSTAPGSTAPGSTAPDSLLSFLAAAKSRRDTL